MKSEEGISVPEARAHKEDAGRARHSVRAVIAMPHGGAHGVTRPTACLPIFVVLLCLAFAFVAPGQSPFAKVQPLALGEARWTAGFWADRFELCRTQMIPRMESLMDGTNYTQFIQNFRIAAGLAEGRSRGAQFNDGDFYKWLEAASASLAATHDVALDQQLDAIIAVIAKAQRADGYLHTPVLIRARNGDTNAVPFKDRNNWELYNLGHLLTAAGVHYRATGKTNLLAVARQAGDFLYATFRDASPELAQGSVCPSHYLGLVDLYRATREPRYLELARKFFALRSQVKEGTDDNQDRIPFGQQTSALGHAARANYLYAGAADLFMETGDPALWKPLEPIWTNVVQQKMYITGGCGALYDGASPDGAKDQRYIGRVHQAYGRNFQLPNVTAHSETCANIGNVLWNWRMFLATGEARFMDVVELALYNSVLSGGSLDGTNFFYTNPLRVSDPMPLELRWSRTRVPFVGSFCCPPNLVRTIAESSGYAYASSGGAIWVNLYGGSTLRTELSGGQIVRLEQETEYPWSGRVRLKIAECGDAPFALKLRIPGWANGASLRINGAPASPPTQPSLSAVRDESSLSSPKGGEGRGEEAQASPTPGKPLSPALSPLVPRGERESEVQRVTVSVPTPGSYFEIRRVWHPGDFVDLDLPLPVRLMEANPLVEEDLNQVAVQRGPVVYCLESPDLPRGTRLNDLTIPADLKLSARYDARLLGGVVVLEGQAAARSAGDWNGRLYREARAAPVRSVPLRLIPYFAWDNRGPSEMTVWLPRGW